ncbi:TPA: hypothetical protein N2D99_002055 [Clostridium botulinum]|nr:hypothetical protein [Clostridium botulinum]
MKFINEKHILSWIIRNDFEMSKTSLSNEVISNIIGGIISKIPLPSNIVLEESSNGYKVLSGDQYIKAIKAFFKKKNSLVETDFIKNVGLTSADVESLADDIMDDLLDTEINFSILRPLSKNDRKLVNSFINVLNNNNDTVIHKVKVVKEETPEFVKEADIDKVLNKYTGHEFFSKVNIKDVDSYILLQLLFVDFNGVPRDMNSKNLDKFRDTLNTVPNINSELDYLNSAFTKSELQLKKVHLPMIFLCGKIALKNKVAPTKFRELILKFLNLDNKQYKNAYLKGGVANKCNVNTRINEMVNWFKNQIK